MIKRIRKSPRKISEMCEGMTNGMSSEQFLTSGDASGIAWTSDLVDFETFYRGAIENCNMIKFCNVY